MSPTAFAPGSIGNVGPGFDVLGLAVDGIGDRVTVELTHDAPRIAGITGRDASLVPADPATNVCSIAAAAMLRMLGCANHNAVVSIEKGLPLSGGLGGSAASAVAGAFAAALALDAKPTNEQVITAALEAEATVAGRHLDNIAPAVLGGLTLVRSIDPIDVIALPVPAWSVVLVTPHVRVETKAARAILPLEWDRASWTQQMANTAALVHAFATADAALLRRALDDRYAEPRRAALIPHFHDVKRAAVLAGAYGCGISGSGPTVFAICGASEASTVAAAMQEAFAEIASNAHVAPIAKEGVRRDEC